jgi:TRAP transporter TAXI family solute receptor
MRKFTIIASFIFASLFMLFTTTAHAQADMDEAPHVLKIYSGFKGGSYYQMAKDMQAMTRKMYGKPQYDISELEVPKINPATGDTVRDEYGEVIYDTQITKVPTGDTTEFIEVRESDGSYYNFLKINKIDVDVTFLQYDVLIYESEKDLGRKFKKTEDIRILLPMGSEEIHIITLKEGKVNDFASLKKKRVAIGSSLQGTHITATYIKEVTGVKWIDVDLPYDKAFRALFSGDIDAFFFVGKAPISDLKTLPKSMKDKLKMISIPANDKLKEAYGEQVEITNSTYSWVTEPIKTYAVKSLLVTSLAGQTPEQVDAITKLLQAIKALKDKEGYHESWKTVNFQKDPIVEWDYFDAALKLYN